MSNRIAFGCAAVLTCIVASSPALGQRSPASKANVYQSSFIEGVEACTATNTTLPGPQSLSGCDPVVPADDVCKFTAKGFGKVKLKTKDDMKILVKLKGLEPACDGETLCLTADMVWTQDGCSSGGSCTSESREDLPLGASCCIATFGQCKIKTTLTTALLPEAVVPGNRTEYTLGEVSINRVGDFTPAPAFRAGVLVP